MKVLAALKLQPDSLRARTPSRVRSQNSPAYAALDCDRASAQQVAKQLLDANASLIHHCRNHEMTDSATHQKIAQIVRANVDGEPN